MCIFFRSQQMLADIYTIGSGDEKVCYVRMSFGLTTGPAEVWINSVMTKFRSHAYTGKHSTHCDLVAGDPIWCHRSWSTLAQVMAWCLTAPGHYQNQSWLLFNTLRPRQNDHHFVDDIFKSIFLNENFWFSNNISLKYVPEVLIDGISSLVQIMAWRWKGDKPLSELMMI